MSSVHLIVRSLLATDFVVQARRDRLGDCGGVIDEHHAWRTRAQSRQFTRPLWNSQIFVPTTENYYCSVSNTNQIYYGECFLETRVC